MDLFTIGHSNHKIETFISLLLKHGITALADVRSHPYSRFLPHFNRLALKEALEKEGIRYVFLGQELGARPSDLECYVDGKAVYEKIAVTDAFNQGLQRVLKGLNQYKISLMCAEKDPLTCHRAILVCQHLRHFDLQIHHILKNGDLESHEDLEERMLIEHGLTEFVGTHKQPIQLSLFTTQNSSLPTKEKCLEKAYKLQGEEIAYVEKRNNGREQSS
ncbi:MAG: DUF488 domain-containing protein [Hydrococcus sp. Prado102]|jgi:uncharacterized protein (DUF488 family)|nr:DUF488 domain-containing protein [Hydrococcus sp. Prado102]